MRRAASSGDSRKMRWDEGSIQPCECASTRDGSRAPMWSHAAFGFMWPMRTFLESRASVTMTNADRHTPSSGISVTLNAAVAGDLLKRENRRFVVMAYAGTHTPEEPLWPLHSRRVICFVVRFRRKALPRTDRPHDLGLQIRRHRFETAVLRRPERAALRGGPDGGRESEHLRDRRLRVDDRDLAFLVDVLDHPASALDLPERGAHEILGHVDEDLLDRLEQGPHALDHRAVDRRSRRRDDLSGAAVDGVFVELRVDEAHLEPHRLLAGEGSLAHRLDVRFFDQLHRLVQVLDPFRRVDEHVRVVDPDDALRLVAVHAGLLELLREGFRVLDPLTRCDFPGADRIDDLAREGLDLHVETVVLVRRLAFERTALAADAFAVHDDRRARGDGDLVVVLDAVQRELQGELAHPGDQVLSRLLIDLDHDTRVRLRDEAQGLHEPREVRCGLRFHRDRHDRVGVMDDLLEGLHLLVIADGRAGDRVLQPDDGDDIAGIDFVHRDPF